VATRRRHQLILLYYDTTDVKIGGLYPWRRQRRSAEEIDRGGVGNIERSPESFLKVSVGKIRQHLNSTQLERRMRRLDRVRRIESPCLQRLLRHAKTSPEMPNERRLRQK
jgi:hypothetical protein